MKELKKYIYLVLIGITLATNTSCNNCLRTFAAEKSRGRIISIATTAYHAKEKDHLKYGNKSATGEKLEIRRAIATDWSVFPVGTKLKIAGNIYVVNDYGSSLVNHARKGLPIVDIYQPSRHAMNKWGVRIFTDVEVIEWGSYEKSLLILKDRLKYSHCRYMFEQIQNKI